MLTDLVLMGILTTNQSNEGSRIGTRNHLILKQAFNYLTELS